MFCVSWDVLAISPFNFSEEEERSVDLSTSSRRRRSEGNDSARLSGWIGASSVPSPIARPQDPLEALLENGEIVRFVHEEGGWLEIWEEMKALGWRWVKSRNPLALEAWIHESPCGTKQLRREEIMDFLRQNVPESRGGGGRASSQKQEEEEEEIVVSESEEEEDEEDEVERELMDPAKRAERIERRVKEQPLLFPELWKELTTLGWSWDYGDGLVDVVYLKPGTGKKKGVKGTDLFESEDEVVQFIEENVPFLARQVKEQLAEAEEAKQSEEARKFARKMKSKKRRNKLRKKMHLLDSSGKKSPHKSSHKNSKVQEEEQEEEEEEEEDYGVEPVRKRQRTSEQPTRGQVPPFLIPYHPCF